MLEATNRATDEMNGHDPRFDGPGLFETYLPDGRRWVHNLNGRTRRLAGGEGDERVRQRGHGPGWRLIATAAWALTLLGGGLLYVSYAGQYGYFLAARHGDKGPSAVASAMFDVGMIVFTLLALGLAMAARPAKTERAWIMLCAFGSSAMNYLAADISSPRSVISYVAPPVFLAVVVDRVVSVIRRHVVGVDEGSAWAVLGGWLRAAFRLARRIVLYSLRFLLDKHGTWQGMRQAVLNATPLPEIPAAGQAEPVMARLGVLPLPHLCAVPVAPTGQRPWFGPCLNERPCPDHGEQQTQLPPPNPPLPPGGGTKKARLLALYKKHADYGDRAAASRVATELAPRADLNPSTARTYLYQHIDNERR